MYVKKKYIRSNDFSAEVVEPHYASQDWLPHSPVAGYPVQPLNSRLFVSNVPDDELGVTGVGEPG